MGLSLPAELDLPVVEALAPYAQQIARARPQIGARAAAPVDEGRVGRVADGSEDAGHAACTACRCSMRRCIPLEANVSLALLHEPGGDNDRKLVSLAVGAFLNLHGRPRWPRRRPRARPATRRTRCWPRRWRSSGRKRSETHAPAHALADRGLRRGRAAQRARRRLRSSAASPSTPAARELLLAPQPDARAQALLAGFDARGAKSVFVRSCAAWAAHRAPTRCWRRSPRRWAAGR